MFSWLRIFSPPRTRFALRSFAHPLCNLGLRITVFLFLLNELKVRFRGGDLIFGLFDLTGRSRALLLQAFQGFEIALRGVARVSGFHQLRLRESKLLRDCRRSGERWHRPAPPAPGQRPRCLAAGVGVVELRQSWPFFTRSPSLTSSFFTVVPTGAWASKLCTGSTFPLVEITLRIVLRSTVAARTGITSSRDMNEASSRHGDNNARCPHQPAMPAEKSVVVCSQCHVAAR